MTCGGLSAAGQYLFVANQLPAGPANANDVAASADICRGDLLFEVEVDAVALN